MLTNAAALCSFEQLISSNWRNFNDFVIFQSLKHQEKRLRLRKICFKVSLFSEEAPLIFSFAVVFGVFPTFVRVSVSRK